MSQILSSIDWVSVGMANILPNARGRLVEGSQDGQS
jgi:hypothetical protein